MSSIILFCDHVTMNFGGQSGAIFQGDKSGRLYLTTHRMIFNNKKKGDPMQSFSFPFVALKEVRKCYYIQGRRRLSKVFFFNLLRQVELEQPIFGANYIKGKVRAQPNGNYTGEARFKLFFKSGGAIDFGQAMLKAAQMGRESWQRDLVTDTVGLQFLLSWQENLRNIHISKNLLWLKKS